MEMVKSRRYVYILWAMDWQAPVKFIGHRAMPGKHYCGVFSSKKEAKHYIEEWPQLNDDGKGTPWWWELEIEMVDDPTQYVDGPEYLEEFDESCPTTRIEGFAPDGTLLERPPVYPSPLEQLARCAE